MYNNYLLKGYIPIIDIKSFPNVINGFNISKNNNWELFFEQPFGYTLDEVLKNAKNIIHIKCHDCMPRPEINIPFKDEIVNFWHYFASKYLPIKREILDFRLLYDLDNNINSN